MKVECVDYRNELKAFPDIDYHTWEKPTCVLHCHNYYEIFFVAEGSVNYTINGNNHILEKGYISFIRPKDVHCFNNVKNTRHKHVNIAVVEEVVKSICDAINPQLFERLTQTDNPFSIILSNNELNIINFYNEKINLSDSDLQQKKSQIINMLWCELSIIQSHINQLSHAEMPIWLIDIVDKISSVTFIDKQVKDIYELCPYSIPIVVETFKKHLNCTPIEYLLRLKINYACSQLKTSDSTTLSIASAIGYNSLSSFNKAFKKMVGISPKEYKHKPL